MPNKPSQIIASLESLLGTSNVISKVVDMAAFINEPRKRFFTPALAVVSPRDVAGVQKLLRWANEHKAALIPQGGNTGLVGAQVPLSGREIIVSLKHLNAVRSLDAADGHMVVEAGLTLLSAHEVAEKAGALFPLTIASEGSATIGGVLSTNAGGTQVLAYGNARALCLGVEAVMADGSLYNGLSALRKDNTGYDLRDLLIGAEGTLGIITAATLKLFPRPQAFETAWINIASPETALQLFQRLHEAAQTSLTAFELMPRFGVDIQLRHKMIERDPSASPSPWYVMAEISVPKGGKADVLTAVLETAFESGLIEDATLATSLADRQDMWNTREQMSESQSREGASIKHDVSVPVSAVPELIARGCAVAEKIIPGIRPCPFGHLGDGNMHFNFTQPMGADPKAYMESAGPLHEAIYEIVLDLGGAISAEHGIGQLKVELLEQVKDPAALGAMVAIKQALDPNNILNPGKVLKDRNVSE